MTVGVEFTCLSDVVLCPLRNLGALVETVWLSVEVNVVHSFNDSGGMEILGVNMELDVRLLVEVKAHEVAHLKASFSALVDQVRPEEEGVVGLKKQDGFRISSLESSGRLEYDISPVSRD